jgi:hypothetical protein
MNICSHPKGFFCDFFPLYMEKFAVIDIYSNFLIIIYNYCPVNI